MASVVGLAPTRFGLKGRLRGLLCIHGQKEKCRLQMFEMQSGRRGLLILQFAFGALHSKWSPRLVSRQRLFGFNEALIYLSYSGGKCFHIAKSRPATMIG